MLTHHRYPYPARAQGYRRIDGDTEASVAKSTAMDSRRMSVLYHSITMGQLCNAAGASALDAESAWPDPERLPLLRPVLDSGMSPSRRVAFRSGFRACLRS